MYKFFYCIVCSLALCQFSPSYANTCSSIDNKTIALHCRNNTPQKIISYIEKLKIPQSKTDTITGPVTGVGLLKAMKDEADTTNPKIDAAIAFGILKARSSVALLSVFLKDEIQSVRENAANALVKIGDASVIPPLFSSLTDEHWKTREIAEQYLSRRKSPVIAAGAIEHLSDSRKYVLEVAQNILNNQNTQDISRALQLGDDKMPSDAKVSAIKFLKTRKPDTVIPILTALMLDEIQVVRETALKTLAEYDDPSTLPVFLSAIEDEHWKTREVAIKYLAKKQSPAVISGAIKFMTHNRAYVREAAWDLIKKLNVKDTAKALTLTLQGKGLYINPKDNYLLENYDYETVIGFLIVQKYQPAAPVLHNMIVRKYRSGDNLNNTTTRLIIMALARLNYAPAAPVLLEILNKKLKSKKGLFETPTNAIILTLGQLKYKPSIPTIRKILSLKKLSSYLDTSAIQALGHMKDDKAVEKIIPHILASNDDVKFAAINALGDIRNKKAIPYLITLVGLQNIAHKSGLMARRNTLTIIITLTNLGLFKDQMVTKLFAKILDRPSRPALLIPIIYAIQSGNHRNLTPKLVTIAKRYKRQKQILDPIINIICKSGDQQSIRLLKKRLKQPRICKSKNIKWKLHMTSAYNYPSEDFFWLGSSKLFYWTHSSNPKKRVSNPDFYF